MDETQRRLIELFNRVIMLERVITILLDGMSRGYKLNATTFIPAPSVHSLEKARREFGLPRNVE